MEMKQFLMSIRLQGAIAQVTWAECSVDADYHVFFTDTMSPNAVFEYAGDRDVIEEDIAKNMEVEEEELTKQ